MFVMISGKPLLVLGEAQRLEKLAAALQTLGGLGLGQTLGGLGLGQALYTTQALAVVVGVEEQLLPLVEAGSQEDLSDLQNCHSS